MLESEGYLIFLLLVLLLLLLLLWVDVFRIDLHPIHIVLVLFYILFQLLHQVLLGESKLLNWSFVQDVFWFSFKLLLVLRVCILHWLLLGLVHDWLLNTHLNRWLQTLSIRYSCKNAISLCRLTRIIILGHSHLR